ncbi:hypothetical protein [Streptomyces sp. NPDC059564]
MLLVEAVGHPPSRVATARPPAVTDPLVDALAEALDAAGHAWAGGAAFRL